MIIIVANRFALFKEVNKRMATPTVAIPEIPPEVKRLTISVGILRPQDGDCGHSLRIVDSDSTEIPAPSYFEVETEGADESSLIGKVITALSAQGFHGFQSKGGRDVSHMSCKRS